MLTLNRCPQASKKGPQLVLQGQKIFEDIIVNKFPSRMSSNVFEINDDKTNKNKCCR